MKAIDLRVREETLTLARALTTQRGLERAALLREALELGVLLIAASGPPAEDGPTETYGTLPGPRLAQVLRPRVVPVLDFLSRYSAAPLVVPLPPVPAPTGPALAQHAGWVDIALPVDDTVNDALDAFGVGALGDP
jgi:hypothetical protein